MHFFVYIDEMFTWIVIYFFLEKIIIIRIKYLHFLFNFCALKSLPTSVKFKLLIFYYCKNMKLNYLDLKFRFDNILWWFSSIHNIYNIFDNTISNKYYKLNTRNEKDLCKCRKIQNRFYIRSLLYNICQSYYFKIWSGWLRRYNNKPNPYGLADHIFQSSNGMSRKKFSPSLYKKYLNNLSKNRHTGLFFIIFSVFNWNDHHWPSSTTIKPRSYNINISHTKTQRSQHTNPNNKLPAPMQYIPRNNKYIANVHVFAIWHFV